MEQQKTNLIAKVLHFIKVEIWSINLKKTSQRASKLIRLLQIIVLASKDFIKKRYLEKSSALSFYTILALVPLVAMAFGIAKGFGFDKYMEDYVISIFADKQDIVNMVLEFSESMLARTQGGLIAGIGVVVLLWTVIKVMGNIESAFNEIWSVNKQRTFIRKISDYLTILLLMPIFLIISYSATSYVTNLIENLSSTVEWVKEFDGLLSFGLKILPYSLLWLAFALLYLIMPNTKVNFKSAFISGILAGIVFQVVQYFYIKFQIGVSNYNAIYGSFAAIPLFLVWLQISWTIILIGAGISYSIQNAKNFEFELEVNKISDSLKTKLSLLILHSIAKRFQANQPPQTSLEISEDIDLPHRITKMILITMVNAGLINEVKTQEDKTFAYAPAFSIDNMDVATCIEKLHSTGINSLDFKISDTFLTISEITDNYSISNNIEITKIK